MSVKDMQPTEASVDVNTVNKSTDQGLISEREFSKLGVRT